MSLAPRHHGEAFVSHPHDPMNYRSKSFGNGGYRPKFVLQMLRKALLLGIIGLFCFLNLRRASETNGGSSPASAIDGTFTTTPPVSKPASSLNATYHVPLVIDIMSIGSRTRPHYQQAQRETFASHPAVRHYWNVTEDYDKEVHCANNLTLDQVHKIRFYCGRQAKAGLPLLNQFARLFASPQYLFKKSNPAGWICAQKRPINAFVDIIQRYYKSGSGALPDYLFLIDDDTYLHMPRVLEELNTVASAAPLAPDELPPVMIAGCLVRPRFMNFSFPFGGWGMFVSKQSLERWIRPLDCQQLDGGRGSPTQGSIHDSFVTHACQQIEQNLIGERPLFVAGMSVADLMQAYTTRYEYLQFDEWRDPGFCLHSDTALAYFSNYYHLTDHAKSSGQAHVAWNYTTDRLLGYKSSVKFLGRQRYGSRKQKRECNYRNDTLCTNDSDVCHYITPNHMRELYEAS